MSAVKLLSNSYDVMVKDLIEFKRNRAALAGLFLMPLLFLAAIGFIFPSGSSGDISVGIVNLDHGSGSTEFIDQMQSMNTSSMDLKTYSSTDAAKAAISQGKVSGTFIIPTGFSYNLTHGKSGNVIILMDNSNPQASTQIQQTASNMVNSLNGIKAETNVLQLSKSSNQSVNPQAVVFPYTPTFQTTIPGQTNYFNFLAPGLMIMIGMMVVMSGIPEAISKEKEMGTFDGMLTAPISQFSIILGKTMALCIRGFFQCIIVLVVAMLFFGVTIHGNMLLAFLMLFLGIFSFIGIGIMATATVGDQSTGVMVMNLLMFPMMFLSGIIYPVQQMPWFMQAVSQLIPLTYAADAMRKIMLLNAGIGDVSSQIIILLAFGVVTMAIALPLFRRSMTR